MQSLGLKILPMKNLFDQLGNHPLTIKGERKKGMVPNVKEGFYCPLQRLFVTKGDLNFFRKQFDNQVPLLYLDNNS